MLMCEYFECDGLCGLLMVCEEEVFKFVVEVYINEEIGELLYIFKKIVECYWVNIFFKLGMCDRVELMCYAIR